jgi:hypothetical protein
LAAAAQLAVHSKAGGTVEFAADAHFVLAWVLVEVLAEVDDGNFQLVLA